MASIEDIRFSFPRCTQYLQSSFKARSPASPHALSYDTVPLTLQSVERWPICGRPQGCNIPAWPETSPSGDTPPLTSPASWTRSPIARSPSSGSHIGCSPCLMRSSGRGPRWATVCAGVSAGGGQGHHQHPSSSPPSRTCLKEFLAHPQPWFSPLHRVFADISSVTNTLFGAFFGSPSRVSATPPPHKRLLQNHGNRLHRVILLPWSMCVDTGFAEIAVLLCSRSQSDRRSCWLAPS
jgi:hypothetical protein